MTPDPALQLLGGEWEAGGGGWFEVEDPAAGEPFAVVADADADDARAALDAAATTQPSWEATSPDARADLLARGHALLLERRGELSDVICRETGKPRAEAEAEVSYAAGYLRWFAGEALRIPGHFSYAPDGRGYHATLRQPVGPCLLVTPWNFPLAMVARKVAPAIAAGCTAIVKPAPESPLTALAFARILLDAGLEPKVLQVLSTSDAPGVVDALLADSRLRKLSFTGSTAVGRALLKRAASHVLRVSLELGGNAPFLVFEDADLDAAVAGALLAKMRNNGQACTAANRFLVAEPVARAFAEGLAAALARLRLGTPDEPGTEVGPLIDAPARDRVAALRHEAQELGARALPESDREGPGYFLAPTVLCDVPAEARVLAEEIFGPLAPIVQFADEEEALARANATDSGLAAYVYTRDADRALRVGAALEAGLVGVNSGSVSSPSAPFGGVKESGLGREGGREGIEEYLAVKHLALAD